jgi:hypothetical protein
MMPFSTKSMENRRARGRRPMFAKRALVPTGIKAVMEWALPDEKDGQEMDKTEVGDAG